MRHADSTTYLEQENQRLRNELEEAKAKLRDLIARLVKIQALCRPEFRK